jgi:hypothetical protein
MAVSLDGMASKKLGDVGSSWSTKIVIIIQLSGFGTQSQCISSAMAVQNEKL